MHAWSFRGIQALFGFQLIAVYNNRFTELSPPDQVLHFVALALHRGVGGAHHDPRWPITDPPACKW